MANSRLLWPSPDEQRQRQELMDQMMEARGVDAPLQRAWMARWLCWKRPRNAAFARMKRHAATGSPAKRGQSLRNSVPTPRFFSTSLKKQD